MLQHLIKGPLKHIKGNGYKRMNTVKSLKNCFDCQKLVWLYFSYVHLNIMSPEQMSLRSNVEALNGGFPKTR